LMHDGMVINKWHFNDFPEMMQEAIGDQ